MAPLMNVQRTVIERITLGWITVILGAFLGGPTVSRSFAVSAEARGASSRVQMPAPGTDSNRDTTAPTIGSRNRAPAYPPESRAAGEQGLVILLLQVDAIGEVRRVGVVKSCGFKRLDEAAANGVKRWVFKPAIRGGKRVASTVQVPIRWALEEAEFERLKK